MNFTFKTLFSLSLSLILISCTTSRKMATPTVEVKNKAVNQPRTDEFLTNLLNQHPQLFDSVLKKNDQWQAQFIYTQIDRDINGKPEFKNFYFNVDPNRYYYPASTVKLPAAILALQRLNELKVNGLTKNTTMITEAGFSGQTAVYNDPTSEDGRPTIEHYIKKILLVSDNDAFNRLYEFLGQEYINNTLHKMKYSDAQIIHRLSISLTEEQNRHTNPVKFYDTSSKIVYQQPLVKSNLNYQKRNHFLGKGYYSGGKLVNEPFDFSKKNRLSITDLHSMLQSIIFPESVPQKQRFNLTRDDYQFLYRYMSMMPAESSFPQYDSFYNNAYVKFLMYGSKDPVNPDVRIFNKVGDAYGFLTDAAYIVDFKNGVEFMLSAVISCNSDGIFNDDKYDYETVGLPFMKNLGQVLYNYELGRKRKNVPDLSGFKFTYGK